MKVVIGVMMMVAAFPLLFWNEGRAVRTAESLEEGRGAVLTTSSDTVDPAREGKLVHTTGRARTADTVSDPLFGVSANAIALNRKVAMYQWKETSESRGRNADSRTYRYTKEWSETLVDSSKFKVPDEHPNPTRMAYKSEKWLASKVTLGAYTLSSSQVDRIPGEIPVKATLPPSASPIAESVREHAGALFIGENADQPKIGDLRVTFSKVGEADVSIVAKQVGSSFAPYRARAGSTVDMQANGIISGDQMFTGAEDANVTTLWGMRFMGFILMAISIALTLKTLTGFVSGIPIVGQIVGASTAVIAILFAAVMSFATIGLAWIFYRPLLGAALLVVGGAAAYGIWRVAKARARQAPPAAGSA